MKKMLVVGFACVAMPLWGCSHTQHAYSPDAQDHVLAGEQAVHESGPIASNDGHVLLTDQVAGASTHPGQSAHGGDQRSVHHSGATGAVESHLTSSDHQHALTAGAPEAVQAHSGLHYTHDHELGAIRDTLYQMIELVQQHTGDEHLLRILEDRHHAATSHGGGHDAVEDPHGGDPLHAIEPRHEVVHGHEADHYGDEHHVGHHEPGHPDEGEHHPAATHGHDAEHKHVHHDAKVGHDIEEMLRVLDELHGELKQHLIDSGLRHEVANHGRLQDHHNATSSRTVDRRPSSHEPKEIAGSNHPVSTAHKP